MRLTWTEQALNRLAEIQDFIAADSPDAASRLVDALIERPESLTRFPEMGPRVPELARSDLRELVEGNYRLVYRVRGDSIEVITVFEGHRLLPESDLPKGTT